MTNLFPFRNFGGDGSWLHLAHANAYPPGAYRGLAAEFRQEYHVAGMLMRPLWPEAMPADVPHCR